MDFDVIIIGAGISGLAAADFQVQQNQLRKLQGQPELTFIVLEGSKRPGGRTLTDPEAKGYLDLGAGYVAPTQSYTQVMMSRFKLQSFETWLPDGVMSQYERADGTLIPFDGPNYPLQDPEHPAGDPGAPGGGSVTDTIDAIETQILSIRAHLERPWEALNATELDSMTIRDYMDQNLSRPEDSLARELLTIAVRSAFSVEPEEMSVLYFLYYGATCGTLRAFENVKGGGDSIRLVTGTQGLLDGLLAAIDAKNTVRYGAKVKLISQTDSYASVTIEGPDGKATALTSQAVIVAMSPGATSRIEFNPPVSEQRKGLVEGAPMAATIKGFLTFDQAWWRNKFTGYALSAAGPADWVLDNTWWDPLDGLWKYPALMTFIVGDRARELSRKTTKDERRAALLAQVYKLFGGNADEFPCTGYYEKDWDLDEWSHGCPAGCLRPGVLTKYGSALRTPHGRVHWAGSEAATDWMGGYMNGAIQSGMRAAGEVLRIL